MKKKMKCWVFLLLFLFVGNSFAQTDEKKYIQVITERSDKIVETLGIMDSVKYYEVRDVLIGQYSALNNHHEQRETDLKNLKASLVGQEKKFEEARANYEVKKDEDLQAIHRQFISKLEKLLDPSQVDRVKDGMTYGVLPLTYAAFQDMIPELTNAQKAKILNWLLEARELAMDAPGSREKHGIFGKFKGRINNYLSAEGYDLKEEGNKWKERQAKAR